ncbi:hypothetical protein ACQPW1_35340 [Nocardia sp. CA-128927]|uniref:hypothetical protein n=1 Tax=Nocardia sp. CA-128927 TaxID=3239975 RepID=UPI003D96AE29
MIHLSFSIPDSSSPLRKTWDYSKVADPANLGELNLIYSYFLVDVEIVINDTMFLISGDMYVTLVDIAVGLRHVAENISRGKNSTLSFAEHDEVLQFLRTGDGILVGSSTKPLRAKVETEELLDGINAFLRSAYSALTEEVAGLRNNLMVQKIIAPWSEGDPLEEDEMTDPDSVIFPGEVEEIRATPLKFFNQTGWIAYFAGTDTEDARIVHVEGWEHSIGTALVVDPKRGALQPVTEFEDFTRLEKADQVVAALPGGGWRAHWKKEGAQGAPLTEQVLAWLITSQGKAITIDASGYVSDADGADTFIPPGEDSH